MTREDLVCLGVGAFLFALLPYEVRVKVAAHVLRSLDRRKLTEKEPEVLKHVEAEVIE